MNLLSSCRNGAVIRLKLSCEKLRPVKIKKAPSRALGSICHFFYFSSYLMLKTTLILLRDAAPVVQVDGRGVELFLQNIQPLQ